MLEARACRRAAGHDPWSIFLLRTIADARQPHATPEYVFGVPTPFDTVELVASRVVFHPIGEAFLVLAPYVALLLRPCPSPGFASAGGVAG